ncbi:MAG TPA: hypothetical protein VKG61_13055, partial [Streptosporangiaceae bacterium]|nr:hypothetical protein [Streptosporangiaceae bacterium]
GFVVAAGFHADRVDDRVRSPAAGHVDQQARSVPGLMRTGSHLQARFTGQAGKEFNERPSPYQAAGARRPAVRS